MQWLRIEDCTCIDCACYIVRPVLAQHGVLHIRRTRLAPSYIHARLRNFVPEPSGCEDEGEGSTFLFVRMTMLGTRPQG